MKKGMGRRRERQREREKKKWGGGGHGLRRTGMGQEDRVSPLKPLSCLLIFPT